MSVSRNENNRVSGLVPDPADTTDEDPVLFMLSAVDTGISLVEVQFQPDVSSDECVLSSFLTAFRHAVALMFARPFDGIRFGKYTMLLRTEPPFLFCYVFRGRADRSVHRLDEFIGALLQRAPLLDSLMNTVLTGAVDESSKSSIGHLAAQVFTRSGYLSLGVK